MELMAATRRAELGLQALHCAPSTCDSIGPWVLKPLSVVAATVRKPRQPTTRMSWPCLAAHVQHVNRGMSVLSCMGCCVNYRDPGCLYAPHMDVCLADRGDRAVGSGEAAWGIEKWEDCIRSLCNKEHAPPLWSYFAMNIL